MVQTDRYLQNFHTIQKHIGNVPIIPVLEGNAYGLGDVAMAQLLVNEGVNVIAVSRIEEAERIADVIRNLDIMLTTPYSTEDEAVRIVETGLIASVDSSDNAVLLSSIARKLGKSVRVQIKFDTGLGVSGFLTDEAGKAAQTIKHCENFQVYGAFTELSNCVGKHGKKTVMAQYEKFNRALQVLRREGVTCPVVHIANTSAALYYPELRMDAVCCGEGLVGRLPLKDKWGLKPVGRLVSAVSEVRWLPAGCTVGYGNEYRTKKPTRIATVPVGSADGLYMDYNEYKGSKPFLPSLIKSKNYCEINGKKTRVIGRAGYTAISVDVTETDCSAGDIVTFDVNPKYVSAAMRRDYV